MSDELRKEAAGLARDVRRVLERERAAGGGDLLARGAKAQARRAQAPVTPAAAPVTIAAPASSGPPPAATAEPERDLFGQPVAPPRPAVTAAPAPEAEEPEPERPLPPRDPEARAAIAAAAAPVLERIAGEVRACRACGLCETRNQAVPGVGSALSGIVFVGEAPGADEDRLGEPFVGRAGQLLDRIIKAVDDAQLFPGVPLDRRTLFIGNVIHCRPPENRVPLAHEVEASSPFLHRQLEALRPRIVCCLGKTAAEHLLRAKATLASMRGRIYRFHGAKLIVTYHTAAVLRNPELKRPVWEDMQLMAREYLQD